MVGVHLVVLLDFWGTLKLATTRAGMAQAGEVRAELEDALSPVPEASWDGLPTRFPRLS